MSSSQLDRLSPFSSRLLYCRGAAMEAAAWTRNLSQSSSRASNFLEGPQGPS